MNRNRTREAGDGPRRHGRQVMFCRTSATGILLALVGSACSTSSAGDSSASELPADPAPVVEVVTEIELDDFYEGLADEARRYIDTQDREAVSSIVQEFCRTAANTGSIDDFMVKIVWPWGDGLNLGADPAANIGLAAVFEACPEVAPWSQEISSSETASAPPTQRPTAEPSVPAPPGRSDTPNITSSIPVDQLTSAWREVMQASGYGWYSDILTDDEAIRLVDATCGLAVASQSAGEFIAELLQSASNLDGVDADMATVMAGAGLVGCFEEAERLGFS